MPYKKSQVPFELYEIDLSDADDEELLTVSDDLSIGLSLDEMKRVRDYFLGKNRNPTDIELQAIGQAWSEHCCYKRDRKSVV